MRTLAATSIAVLLAGCATIVNDPNIPLAFSFSDGSSGHCDFRNKRGAWSAELPATNVLIRRSDDELVYDCTTDDGRVASGAIRSEIEGEKMAASVIFWDLGITDAITDKHRTYQGNVVIPLPKAPATAAAGVTGKIGDSESAIDPLAMSIGDDDQADAADPNSANDDPH